MNVTFVPFSPLFKRFQICSLVLRHAIFVDFLPSSERLSSCAKMCLILLGLWWKCVSLPCQIWKKKWGGGLSRKRWFALYIFHWFLGRLVCLERSSIWSSNVRLERISRLPGSSRFLCRVIDYNVFGLASDSRGTETSPQLICFYCWPAILHLRKGQFSSPSCTFVFLP